MKADAETKLIDCWLEPNPHKPGAAEWRLKGTGLPAWRVVGQLAAEVDSDNPAAFHAIIGGEVPQELVERVAVYYDVPAEAISATLAYARRHADDVIARLVLDRAAISG